MVWYSHLSISFPQFAMIQTVRGFSVVDETEIDVFLKFPCFLYNPANVGNLISSSSSFSKPSLDIWKFLVWTMLKTNMQDFKHGPTSTGDECNCPMVSTNFGTALLGNWDEDWPFLVLWPLLGVQICWHNEYKTLTASSFKDLNSSAGILSHPLALLTAVLLKAHLTLHCRTSGSGWLITPL